MSNAAAAADAPPAKGNKKMLLIIVAVVVLLLAVLGVVAVLLMKKSGQDEDVAEEAHAAPEHAAVALDPKHPPAYVPLDAFTVNLADKDADRYAQIAMTLELQSPETADAIKAFMPAVRNNILLTLAHKTAAELLEADGKAQLAEEIRRETSRALGVEVEDEDDEDEHDSRKKKRSRKAAPPPLPVAAVYFSTFIIQ